MTRFRGIKFTELPTFEIWIGEKEREFVRGSCDLNLTCQLFENGMFLFLENRTIESYIDMRRTHTYTRITFCFACCFAFVELVHRRFCG